MASLVCMVALVSSGCGDKVDSLDTQSQPPREAVAAATDPPAPPPLDPVKLRQDALLALQSGDVDKADELIRASISAAPDDTESIYLLAIVLGKKNRFPEAIRMLDKLAETVPSRRLPILGQTADWMVLHGQWQEAEDRYLAVLDLAPNESMVHRRLARLQIRQGRRLEAAPRLREMCRQGDVVEAELRTLLRLAFPFAGDATIEEFDPVSALGNARLEIGQGNWDAAADNLQQLTDRGAAESALLGRVYAQQKDFESLAQWVAETVESDDATADHWFAMGAHAADQNDHATAVKYFCATVLRDPTDKDAYSLLSQSLEELGADSEATEAAKRAELIAQTQVIGHEMADSTDRNLQKISTLADLLDQLQRPFEALAWRAVQLSYQRSALSEDEFARLLGEINRERLQRLETGQAGANEPFLLCGVDLDALSVPDDADTASDENK